MEKEFEGKYAIVTGGAGGIGFESAKVLAERGLSGVILADMNEEAAKKSAEALEESTGCKAYAFPVNVASPESIEQLFRFASEKLPALHILINCAGVCPVTPVEELDAEKWDWCMNINLRGAHLCVREAFKTMKEQKYGKIINIASIAARIGGIASSVSYAASKGGLLAATKSYAKLFAPYGINVNAVCPGVVRTPMTANTEYSTSQIPLGRLGETSDIAGVIAFLASDDSCYITGAGIDVNGGQFML